MKVFGKLINWYFRKKALPYWCLLLVDSAIVLFSLLFTYWLFHRTGDMFTHRFGVLYASVFYMVVSWIGARMFSTYLGVVRYSSFVDLLQVAYANGTSLLIILCLSLLFEELPFEPLAAFSQTEIVVAFFLATLQMWAVRILVKSLHDVSHADANTLRTLIYGAMTGGVGLAKNIRSQKPSRFTLCGFISHNRRARHMTLLGKRIYDINDDIASVIEKERIQAVLVSPTRLAKFRDNQEFQDLLIRSGVKIFIAQSAKEARFVSGEMTDEDFEGLQFKEVQVEDLLPRSEIKVDMASVGKMLTGKKVLITGSAGSIGSEMVRQVAIYRPAAMMLIDQAETPEHDVRLMMRSEYPGIDARTVVTSICRQDRMEAIFREFRPDYVFHAAAYKHVPMMEDNPSEAVLNNIEGTKILADLSVKYGVKKFVMVSTDKAVNPTNASARSTCRA